MEYNIHQLDNGIRLIHKVVNSPVAHCGIIINTGSRDETEDQHGMAHLVEHLLFKGTKKRKAFHILSRMEDVGGELNAYTTKEETAVYTTFFNNYYARAFDLISDIIFNSTYPVKEIKKEKEIIIDEINSYKDSPVDMIFDDFEELVFAENPLSRNILGSEESLRKYTQKDIQDFIYGNYDTNQMVIASVGSLDFKKVRTYFERFFSEIATNKRKNGRIEFNHKCYRQNLVEISKDTHQAHCLIGSPGYSYLNDKRLVLHLINNLLGGPGMNSRLNLALREKRGYAYNVESNYTTYTDTGIVAIYFGTDRRNLNKCINIILKELARLRNKPLGPVQLSKAKKQLIGQIALSSENNENQMLSIGKSLLVYNKVDSLEIIRKKIEAITARQIMEVANEIFQPDHLSQLRFV